VIGFAAAARQIAGKPAPTPSAETVRRQVKRRVLTPMDEPNKKAPIAHASGLFCCFGVAIQR
jgi:hypothetical protein